MGTNMAKTERKVTVILATDVVGYSVKMEENEDQTLKNLKVCRNIIDGLVEEHHGRIFNTAGDSVLAEFQSAVEAVICASEFQSTIKERNNSVPEEEQMEFRIGINMGDVVIEGENLYGEGVNVAARLEALAQPGGVCLSKNVHEIVNKKTDFQFHDLGEQKVKNTVLHAVDVKLDGTTQRKLTQTQKISQTAPWKKYSAVFILAALIAGGGVWWQQQPDFKPANQSKFAFKLPDKPSIAVLPFKNLHDDKSDNYIAEGISQNLTNQISRSSEIFVITYSSAKKVAAESSDPKQIARSLGVRFILNGSVQRSGDDLRVNVELLDALENSLVWTNQFDGKKDNLFSFQDRIAENIFVNFKIKLASNLLGENATEFSSVEQMQKVLKFREKFLMFSREGHIQAKALAEEINEEYPGSGPASLVMAWLSFQEIMMGMTEDREKSIKQGAKHAELAHTILNDGLSLIVGAWMDLFLGDASDRAKEKVAKAIEIDQSGDVLSGAANIFLLTGEPLAAKQLFKRAMRISPFHPVWYANRLSEAMIMLEEYDEAREILEELVSKSQEDGINLREKSRALVALSFVESRVGNTSAAREKIKDLRLINPNFSAVSVKNYLGMVSDKQFLNSFLENAINLGLPKT
jgi:TolB-like protein/class 3 adenylate cyclase